MITVICNEDEVSGTTILDDGTKAYWSEGRSSPVVFRKPDGEVIKVSWEDHVLVQALHAVDDRADVESRMATPEEEAEHYTARN